MKEVLNFRAYYYQKAGLVGVDQRKLLQAALDQRRIDLSILKDICQKYSVPASYRVVVWKILLEILPNFPNNFQYYEQGNQDMFEMDIKVLKTIGRSHVKDEPSQLDTILWCCLIREGKFGPGKLDKIDPVLRTVGTSVLEMFPDMRIDEQFDLTRCFYNVLCTFRPHVPAMVEEMEKLLGELEPQLLRKLRANYLFQHFPVLSWFETSFCGLFPGSSLQRIWDKVIAGSFQFLIPVAVSLFISRKASLLSAENVDKALLLFGMLSEETSEAVTNHAVELWNLHCPQLQHIGHTESPK